MWGNWVDLDARWSPSVLHQSCGMFVLVLLECLDALVDLYVFSFAGAAVASVGQWWSGEDGCVYPRASHRARPQVLSLSPALGRKNWRRSRVVRLWMLLSDGDACGSGRVGIRGMVAPVCQLPWLGPGAQRAWLLSPSLIRWSAISAPSSIRMA